MQHTGYTERPANVYYRRRIMYASLLGVGVGVGKYSHISGGEPQFPDNISVADDHDQSRR